MSESYMGLRRPGNGMALIVGLTGVVLTCFAYARALQEDSRRQFELFERSATTYLKLFEERRDKYDSMLSALRSVFVFGGELNRERFGLAARDLLDRNSGVQALQWVPRVRSGEREEVEARARSEGFPAFRFSERDAAGNLVPGRERSEYFPILIVEPILGNESAMGCQISDDQIQPQLDWARDTGSTTTTPVFRLIQREGEVSLFVVLIPVYHAWPPPGDVPSRREGLKGYLQAVFHVPQLFASVAAEMPTPGIDILFLDPSAPPSGRVLYSTAASTTQALQTLPGGFGFGLLGNSGPLSIKSELPMGGRHWHVQFRANSLWIKTHRGDASTAMLVGGMCVSAFLAAGFIESTRREHAVARQVEDRTRELQAALALLEKQVDQRKQTETALLHSQSHLLAAQRLGRIGSWVLDLRNDSLVWSMEVYRIFGRNDDSFVPTRQSFIGLVHPEDREAVKQRSEIAIRDCAPYHIEHRIVLPDLSIRHVVEQAEVIRAADGKPAEMIGAVQDISERKRAEAEREILNSKIQEVQKWESLGVLAGGIAHDFNNLLAGILGNAGLARLNLPPGSGAASALDQIDQASKRAADLCAQMLAYSGKGKFSIQEVELSRLVRETSPLMRLSIPKSCELRLDLAPGLPSTRGDLNQLKQIIMNVVINASESITQSEGVITVTTGSEQIDSKSMAGLRCAPELASGDYVFVQVSDTGCGLTPETMAKIFDPFFTTKFAGRGLGLAATFGVVRGHLGAIKVTSVLGQGSTFKVLLPSSEVREVGFAQDFDRRDIRQGAASVMIIDDEDGVRAFVSTVLTHQGFRVLEARDGGEGLDLFRASGGEVQLVLLDLMMPRMGGEETLLALRDIRPDVRVLIMSGFSESEMATYSVGQVVQGYLQKPFDGKQLVASVKRAMGTQVKA